MKTVLVTRPKDQAEPFVRELEKYGLISVVFPTIEILPVPGWSVPDLKKFDGAFFTSPNSVRFFLERLLQEAPLELESLRDIHVWAVGKTTSKDLGVHGIVTEPLPKIADAVNLMAEIDDAEIKGKSFLFLKGNLSLGIIPELIAAKGGLCTEITVYDNRLPSLEDTAKIKTILQEGGLSCLSFTSPSTAENFFQAIEKKSIPEGTLIAAIGTTTAAALEKLGVTVDVIPEYFDGPTFAKAIADALKKEPET
ncbi:MAG: uroporphyrinogen-III synthase [Chlorobium sp.]|jgi:uroporphyrinogen-III synthase|nr:uroporphyrinogen-III synthase [Chlorobium sp.]